MSDVIDDGLGPPWHQRLLRRTSLPAQLLHSATSFLMMAGMARFAPSDAFALAAAFFLLVTLTSSLNVYVLSAAWLRGGQDEGLKPQAAFTLLISLGLSLLLAGVWAGYRHWAFGPASTLETVVAGLAGFSYLFYLAWRRRLLLDARFGLASLGDGLRAVLIFGGAVALHRGGLGLGFDTFLYAFLCGHLAAVVPVTREILGDRRSGAGGWWSRALNPLAAITRSDWLGVLSGLANVVFSQAASLLAPMVIGAASYATLRAYELFLFPVMFMAQLLDPLYMRSYRGAVESAAPIGAAEIMKPALLMFTPLALVLGVAVLFEPVRALLLGLVAPDYRAEAWLLAPVLALSGWIAVNAPIRWRLTVSGAGVPLLKGTAMGIVVSLLLLWVLAGHEPQAWTVLAAKIAYESCLMLAGLAGLWTLRRGRGGA